MRTDRPDLNYADDTEGHPDAPGNRADPLSGDSADLELYRAIRRYVEGLGGSIVVIGGIEIQKWPDERDMAYRVAVRCIGRAPEPQP